MGFEVGVAGGVSLDNNSADSPKPGLQARAVLAYPILNPLQAEINYSYAELSAKDFFTTMAPLDLRLRFSPFHTEKWVPYIYGGIGMMAFTNHKHPLPEDAERRTHGLGGLCAGGCGRRMAL